MLDTIPAQNGLIFDFSRFSNAPDAAVVKTLRAQGWVAIRFWEHELGQPERILQKLKAKFEKVRLRQKFLTTGKKDLE